MESRKILKNFNLFLEGEGYLGKVEEVTLPNLTWKIEEFQGGGMIAPLSARMGLEKLSTSFVIKSFETKALKCIGGANQNNLSLTFRGALSDADGVRHIRCEMRGIASSIETAAIKVGESSAITFNMDLSYIKFLENNQNIYEIDIKNHVFKTGDVDYLADERKALGI